MRISEIIQKCVSVMILVVISAFLTGCEEKTYPVPYPGEGIDYDHFEATLPATGGTEVFKVKTPKATEYHLFQAEGYEDDYLEDIIFDSEDLPVWIKSLDVNPEDGTLTVTLKESYTVKTRFLRIKVNGTSDEEYHGGYGAKIEIWQEGKRPDN